MKKLAVFTFVILICVLSVTGCMVSSGNITINGNGSGSCTLYTGYTEDAYNQIAEMLGSEQMAEFDNEFVPFEYNGNKYKGQITSFNFDSIQELNETIMLCSQNVDTGTMSFKVNESGKLLFTLETNEDTGSTEELEQQAEEFEIDEDTAKLLESMVVMYDISFPSEVRKVSGPETEGISVDGKRVIVDYLKLAESLSNTKTVFSFECDFNITEEKTEITFDDVKESDWYFKQVTEMTKAGLFKGKGNNLFCPNDTMNKAEFVTVIARLIYDEPTLNLLTGKSDAWWDKYYMACIENEIFTESEIGYDTMEQGIKRQEMAEIAFGYTEKFEGVDKIDVEKIYARIPDIEKVDEKFRESVAYCYSLGILCGTDDKGSFNPEGTLTRAEASTVIYRLTNSLARTQQ